MHGTDDHTLCFPLGSRVAGKLFPEAGPRCRNPYFAGLRGDGEE